MPDFLDDIDDESDEDYEKKLKKKKYPKCYVDKEHDNDPICKECALDLYGVLPKKKFKYPRNCWSCEEKGFVDTDDDLYDDSGYESD